MAPSPHPKIGVGNEVSRSGLASLSDEFHTLFCLLDAAGLTFVLEHPCRILFEEVEEFFINVKPIKEGSMLISFVKGIKIKISPETLAKYLQLSEVEAEEELVDKDWLTTARFCGMDSDFSTVKRNKLNAVGKLLLDIISKALFCKTGSQGHVSEEIFLLMIGIVTGKKRDWASILFSNIRACINSPNFARIISLFLNQFNPAIFNMSKGTVIHHLKKIDVSSLQRWEIRIKKPGVASAPSEGENLQSAVASVTETPVHQPDPAPSSEGQKSLVTSFPPSSRTRSKASGRAKLSIRSKAKGQSSLAPSKFTPSSPLPDTVPSTPPPSPSVFEAKTSLANETVSNVLKEIQQELSEVHSPCGQQAGSGADFVFDLEDDDESVHALSPPLVHVEGESELNTTKYAPDELGCAKDNVDHSLELKEIPDVAPVAAPAGTLPSFHPSPPIHDADSLLGKIEAMLKKQSEQFENSLTTVHRKIASVESELGRELAKIKSNYENLSDLVCLGSKQIDHATEGVGTVLAQTIIVTKLQESASDKAEANTFRIVDEVGKFKEDTLQTLSVEVRKGEDIIMERMTDLVESSVSALQSSWNSQFEQFSTRMLKQVADINAYSFKTATWLHNQIFPELEIDPDVPVPQFSPRPEDFVGKDPSVADQSDRTGSKRKRNYGEGPSASRSVPSSSSAGSYKAKVEKSYPELWSPVSKDITLESYKLVHEGKLNRSECYSSQEWEKHETAQRKRRIHFRAFGYNNSDALDPPPFYHPKPHAYFSRQEEKRKRKS